MRPLMVRLGTEDIAPILRHIDWAVLVFDIKATLGLKHNPQIAALINKPPTTLQSWIDRGSEPPYSDGAAILELHSRACGEEKTRMRLGQFRERATRSASD